MEGVNRTRGQRERSRDRRREDPCFFFIRAASSRQHAAVLPACVRMVGFPKEDVAVTDKPARSRRKAARTPGDRLQEEILSLYALDPGERVLLAQAGAVLNTLTRVNEQVAAEQSLTAKGSRGQPTVSPLVRAQSELSATLARLLESLALPSPDEEEGELSSTRRARKAALVRWSREAR